MDKKLIFFLIFAFAFACTKDDIQSKKKCSVTISNANPIQFWLTGEETFNGKVVCSIYPVCFCQNFDCDDNINIQFTDTDTFDFQLLIYDSSGISILKTLTFNPDNNNNYSLYFKMSDYALCQTVQFKIQETEKFVNGDFETGVLTPWASVSDGGVFAWAAASIGGDASAKMDANFSAGSGSTRTTIALRHDYDQISATAKTFNYKIVSGARSASVGSWNNSDFVVVYYRNGIEVSSQVLQVMASATIYTGSFLTTETNFDAIGLRIIFKFNSPFTGAWRIDVALFEPASLSSTIVAQSDCVDITDDVDDCSTLIQYSNTSNFAGLIFQSTSPNNDFFLRIPAVFFDENYPQEQEDLELSDDTIITLWSKIEGKKTLDIGYMPFYMHKKLQFALMMDSVSIDGIEYRMRDAYQITAPASKRSALRRASVTLSEKDFINRNLL